MDVTSRNSLFSEIFKIKNGFFLDWQLRYKDSYFFQQAETNKWWGKLTVESKIGINRKVLKKSQMGYGMNEKDLNENKLRRSIKELSDQLISQIAAGEVIERPASVAKELVENAIDANASHIQVRLDGGGIKRIVVSDDGSGIPKDELILAVKRHATSKVRNLGELESVETLGFRGEALASIDSVSSLVITSRIQDGEAFSISEGLVRPAAGKKGTRIEVEDLFYKTPARRKFLKKEQTELAHCLTCIERIALAYPNIEFTVVVDGKPYLSLPSGDLKSRLERLMPKEVRQSHRTIDVQNSLAMLAGWVELPTSARNRTDYQFFYVNGRFVKDRLLMHAVRQAYQDVLYGNNQPAYCLFLSVDPSRVDVNVHPTKSEVRFRDGQMIHQFVFHAVEAALAQTEISELRNLEKPELPNRDDPLRGGASTQPANFVKIGKGPQAGSPQKINQYLEFASPVSPFKPLFSTEQAPQQLPEGPQPLGRAVGQIGGNFIVAENSYGMVLVDMHAAHERIVYEKLKKSFEIHQIPLQQLLIPVVVKVTADQMEAFEDAREELDSLGLELSPVAENQLSLRAVPEILDLHAGSTGEKLVCEVLDDIVKYGKSSAVTDKLNEVLARIACHSAIRVNRALAIEEMDSILRQMENTERADECNHGRPTWVQISFKELNDLFMRGK